MRNGIKFLLAVVIIMASVASSCKKDNSVLTVQGAANPSVNVLKSATLEDLTVPTNVVATVVGTTVTVTWNAVPSITYTKVTGPAANPKTETVTVNTAGYHVVFMSEGATPTELSSDPDVITLTITRTGISPGNYSVKVLAVADLSGHNSEFSAKVLFTVADLKPKDVTAPILTHVTVPALPDGLNGWFIHDVGLLFTAADPESGIASTNPSPLDRTITTEGVNVLVNSATNGVGLTTHDDFELKLDKTPPIVILNTLPSSIILGESVAVTGTMNDVTSGFASGVVNVAGVANSVTAAGTFSFPFVPASLGAYLFSASGTDNAGNEASSGSAKTINVIAKFGGWRPPVSLMKTNQKSGSTLPVKFLATDINGKPIITGLNVMVNLGSVSTKAILDDPTTGQYKAEFVLGPVGVYVVSLTGNIQPATISVTVGK